MSEPIEHSIPDVDTRTDIYSLGVVLYELLTGTTPLEREQLRTAAYNEVLRLIKEVEPPRLSGSDSLPTIAAQRSIDPRHLQKSVAGNLDWIVMKSLEKERSRRYETATSLQRDIERFLNEEAVEACPPSKLYRIKKYLKKHKLQAGAPSAVVLALVVGTAGATWGWFQARDAEKTVRRSLTEVTIERNLKNAALKAETHARVEAEKKSSRAEAQRAIADSQLIHHNLTPRRQHRIDRVLWTTLNAKSHWRRVAKKTAGDSNRSRCAYASWSSLALLCDSSRQGRLIIAHRFNGG